MHICRNAVQFLFCGGKGAGYKGFFGFFTKELLYKMDIRCCSGRDTFVSAVERNSLFTGENAGCFFSDSAAWMCSNPIFMLVTGTAFSFSGGIFL